MKHSEICGTCRIYNPAAETVFGISHQCKECVLPQLEEQANKMNIVFDESMTEESMKMIVQALRKT